MASPLPYEPTPEAAVEHAQRHRQVIVTQNHDMMTLCEELGQRFIWIDPRSRQLHREQQVPPNDTAWRAHSS